jgi:glycosyltransferase involved in cell wall biosynthesis
MYFMNILHISGARIWGGNEQQLVGFIAQMQAPGTQNTVFGVDNSPLQKACAEMGIAFIAAKKEKLNTFANYAYLKQLVKEHKPDVIHLHTSDSLTVYTIADLLFRLKTPAVFSKKGMGSKSSLLSKFKYNYKNVARIICVSARVKEDFSVILSDKNKLKTVVLHDGVSPEELDADCPIPDLRKHFGIDPSHYIVGNIGNHTAAKDLPTLINTADYLVNTLNVKNVAFVQVGGFSKLTPELKALVAEKNLENVLFFTDKVAKAYSFNRQFDVFLMTSQREGGPTSVLEAKYLQTLVISTHVGVVPDVITNGVNGYICPVKDHEALALRLRDVLADAALRQQFALKGKDVILEGFTFRVLAPQLLEVYKSVVR